MDGRIDHMYACRGVHDGVAVRVCFGGGLGADDGAATLTAFTCGAVGKALELFMVQLVSKSAEIARDKGTKKVSAHMLKQVVEADDQWDFLREIVSRVEVDKEGGAGGKAKAKADSDTEDDEPKKKGRGGRKKKSIDS